MRMLEREHRHVRRWRAGLLMLITDSNSDEQCKCNTITHDRREVESNASLRKPCDAYTRNIRERLHAPTLIYLHSLSP